MLSPPLSSFVPTRLLPMRHLPRHLPRLLHPRQANSAARTTPTCVRQPPPPAPSARERRRAAKHAHLNAHLSIKHDVAARRDVLLPVVAFLPRVVRSRFGLSARLARVKLFLARADLRDTAALHEAVAGGLRRLFPELSVRGVLSEADGGGGEFSLRVDGVPVLLRERGAAIEDEEVGEEEADPRARLLALLDAREACRTERGANAADEVPRSPPYIELIPHKLPPAAAPPSPRMQRARAAADAVARDAQHPLHMMSFFKFVALATPEHTARALARMWGRLGIVGRTYVAPEGINAQLAVPAATLRDFRDAMSGTWMENGETLVPPQLIGVFLNSDRVVARAEQPFDRLAVKAREKILADGLAADAGLDWSRAGREVAPGEWHALLCGGAREQDMIVLDCRNDYESDVGRFQGAEPLNTKRFRDTWAQLEERLKGERKDKPILTYCTGGIRCVKVNAFLEQKMGFTNTGRLSGGIVSYARQLREEGRLEASTFKGVNHVFDGRMGEVITDDLLHMCINCGQACNVQTDCANVTCPRPFDKRMFVQCEDCALEMRGACSEACRGVLLASGDDTASREDADTTMSGRLDMSNSECDGNSGVGRETESEAYADAFSVDEDPLLAKVRQETKKRFPRRAHMLSSHAQASLLQMLIQVSGARRVLEIGTFSGYSALAMAQALPEDGVLVTCEADPEVAQLAAEYFLKSDSGRKIVLKVGKGMHTMEDLATGHVFDMAFIDADKGGYRGYAEALLDGGLVKAGGVMVFDNVLFRGEVAKVWRGRSADDEEDLASKRLRNLQSVRKTAKKLHDFNEYLKQERRVKQTVLAMRDGVTIATVVDKRYGEDKFQQSKV